MIKRWKRLLRWLALLSFAGALLASLAVYLVYRHYAPQLPEVATLRDVRFQVPLKVYSRDGKLIANFGEARRFPAAIGDVPDVLKQAFIATEDERFYEHPGVDYQGMARVGWEFVRAGGEFGSGGSTITMQLARNFFLSPERRLERKLKEILLALKIERELSKDEILGLYLNKIFLGQRAYGVAAAAQVYYGKALPELSLAEAAMIAGLPKAPSDLNPVQNPQRALERRNYVLLRMREVGYIDEAAYQAALATPEVARIHELPIELEAPYVAEMARLEADAARLAELRGRLEQGLAASGAAIFSRNAPRLPNTTFFALAGIDGETLVAQLDRAGFALASGSACSSVSPEPSHTLLAMGVEAGMAKGALRVSLGRANTDEDVARFLQALDETVRKLKGLAAVAA